MGVASWSSGGGSAPTSPGVFGINPFGTNLGNSLGNNLFDNQRHIGEENPEVTSAQYNRWTAPFRDRPHAVHALLGVNHALTLLGYVAYPLLLVVAGMRAFIWKDATSVGLFWRELLVPALSFFAVSMVRAKIVAPRPYETLDIVPLIPKDTHGRSFPSRHVFSAFVIAMGWLACCMPVGVALLVAGGVLAVVRVLGGVHWPRDVAAGAALGIAAGLLIL